MNIAEISYKHGCAGRGRKTPEYRTWIEIKTRCYNPKATGYKYWGGRGITMCDAWKDSFQTFVRDVGPKPSPEHSIDRIDPNGDYEPSNVRWATRIEQNRNVRRKAQHGLSLYRKGCRCEDCTAANRAAAKAWREARKHSQS